jgi:hypothetical protein
MIRNVLATCQTRQPPVKVRPIPGALYAPAESGTPHAVAGPGP